MTDARHPESKRPPAQAKKNILFFNYIHSDGLGDLGHLIDITNPKTLAETLPKKDSFGQEVKYQPIYIITCNCAISDRIRFIINSLKESGIMTDTENPYDLNDFSQLAKYIHHMHNKNPHIHLCTNDFMDSEFVEKDEELLDEQLFQTQAEEACAAFHISLKSRIFSPLLKQLPFATTIIEEHTAHANPNLFLQSMGLKSKLAGILLKKPVASSLEEKGKVLTDIQNKKYLLDLLNLKDEKEISATTTTEFLKNTLFIPGYLQTGVANAAFIHSLATSNPAKEYKEIVFHVNGSKLDTDWINADFLGQHGFDKITYYNQDQEPTTTNIKNATGNRHLRIFSNYSLNNHDYISLYQIAQLFAGCSGDKTLELVLSNYLIPFYEERPWKDGFADTLAELATQYKCNSDVVSYIKTFSKFGKICDVNDHQKLCAEITNHINPEFISDWRKLIDHTHQHYNFYEKLPDIMQNTLRLHDLTEAVEKDNYALAKQILENISNTKMQILIEWALERDLYRVAVFIYQLSNLKEMKIEERYTSTLNYLALKYQFNVEKEKPEQALLLKNMEETFQKNFLEIIESEVAAGDLTTPTANFFKPGDSTEAALKQLKPIIRDKKSDTNEKFTAVAKILIDCIKTKEASPLIANVLHKLSDIDNLPLQIYLGIPNVTMYFMVFNLKNIEKKFPELLPAFTAGLELKITATSKPAMKI